MMVKITGNVLLRCFLTIALIVSVSSAVAPASSTVVCNVQMTDLFECLPAITGAHPLWTPILVARSCVKSTYHVRVATNHSLLSLGLTLLLLWLYRRSVALKEEEDREQLERSKQRLYHERAQIIAARLGMSAAAAAVASRPMQYLLPNRPGITILNTVQRPPNPTRMTSQRPPLSRPMMALMSGFVKKQNT
ncbi:hypothetical protein Tco_0039058 [Tanacetum coccineum]